MLWLPGGSESFSPIVKIPLLFSSAYLVYRAVSPPNPVAGKSATAAYDGKHDTLSATTTWMALASVARVRRTHILFHALIPYYLFQSVHWLNAITESAIIIGSRYPSYLPPMLLRLLLREPQRDVSDIRLTPIWLSGCLLMISGSLIRLSCYRILGRLFTWDLTIKDDHNLVTSGPYLSFDTQAIPGVSFSTLELCCVILERVAGFLATAGWRRFGANCLQSRGLSCHSASPYCSWVVSMWRMKCSMSTLVKSGWRMLVEHRIN